jgi:hypothetical protein
VPLCKIDGSDLVSTLVLDLLKCSWICFQNKDRPAETILSHPGSGNPTTRRACAETIWAATVGTGGYPRPRDNCEFAQTIGDGLEAVQKGEREGDSQGKESMAVAVPTVDG